MSLLTIFVDREGISGGATYGIWSLDIPVDTWQIIKERQLLVSDTRSTYFQKYPSLNAGKYKVKKSSRLKDFCTENIDGSAIFNCYTLEDVPRNMKVQGETCIPAGVYPVTLIVSPKFGRGCPAIENVPGFDGIRIHAGTSKGWTEGCVLVGFERNEDNSRMTSASSCETVVWSLLANLLQVGHTLQIDIRFSFQPEEQLPPATEPNATQKQIARHYMNVGFTGNFNANNFQSIGEAGDCGCYSLSDLDPNLKGDYATQNTKTFFDKTAELVHDLVKNKVVINSYTTGNAKTGLTVTPIVQDLTDYTYHVPTAKDLVDKIEEATHGKKLDLKSKENVVGTVSFDLAFSKTITYEGEYFFNPLDSASEKKYGLSFEHDKQFLELYKVKKIKDLDLTTANKIYNDKYWTPFGFGNLTNQDVANLLFDTMVVCGIENGQNTIKNAVKDNYGVQAPNTTTWSEYMTVVKYVEGPQFVGELLEARINYHKAFVLSKPELVVYYDDWIKRCEDYRVEILQEDVSGANTKYFVNIFRAIDLWLKEGSVIDSVYNGVHLIYNNSIMVNSFIPPRVLARPSFVGVEKWGFICQARIDSKNDWSTDKDVAMESQWKIVSECLEQALNQNIVPTSVAMGVSTAGQFDGVVSSFLIWSKPVVG